MYYVKGNYHCRHRISLVSEVYSHENLSTLTCQPPHKPFARLPTATMMTLSQTFGTIKSQEGESDRVSTLRDPYFGDDDS